MSQKRRGKAVPWSYSSLTAYEQCPRRFYLTRIAKEVVEPQTEATQMGNEVHRALERYVGDVEALPAKYAQYKPLADSVRMAKGDKLLEYKFGLTEALQPCGFFDGNVWARGVLDVCIVRDKAALVLDWKTGSRKPDSDQLRMFAGAALSLWPHVQAVKTGYVWLKEGRLDTQTFTPDDKQPIFREFAIRVHRMAESERNDNWPARPSGLCREWCPVGRRLCDHCGRN